MPFVSDAQRKFAFATHQPWAKEWARETPKGKKLPRHVKKKAKRKGVKSPKRGRGSRSHQHRRRARSRRR